MLSEGILVVGLEVREGRRDLGQAALGLWSAKSCSRVQTECRAPDGGRQGSQDSGYLHAVDQYGKVSN